MSDKELIIKFCINTSAKICKDLDGITPRNESEIKAMRTCFDLMEQLVNIAKTCSEIEVKE